jgi:hypothetical protein
MHHHRQCYTGHHAKSRSPLRHEINNDGNRQLATLAIPYPNVGILNPVGTAFASGQRVDTTLPRV